MFISVKEDFHWTFCDFEMIFLFSSIFHSYSLNNYLSNRIIKQNCRAPQRSFYFFFFFFLESAALIWTLLNFYPQFLSIDYLKGF